MKKFMLLAIVAMFATISTVSASLNHEDPPKRPEWNVSDQCRETTVNYNSRSGDVTIERSENENYKATVYREDGSVRQWNNKSDHSGNRYNDSPKQRMEKESDSNPNSGKATRIDVDCW